MWRRWGPLLTTLSLSLRTCSGSAPTSARSASPAMRPSSRCSPQLCFAPPSLAPGRRGRDGHARGIVSAATWFIACPPCTIRGLQPESSGHAGSSLGAGAKSVGRLGRLAMHRRSRLVASRARATDQGQDAGFSIYAHPTDVDAQAAAKCLFEEMSLLTSRCRPDEVQALEVGCPGRACAIYFGPRHGVELLLAGEAVGKGLTSELPRVLHDLCSLKGMQQDVLVKAIGKKNKGLEIVDATAGFGHDALRMAAAGHRVVAFERDPVVHAFVREGLGQLRLEHGDLWHERIVERHGSIVVRCAEARHQLEALQEAGKSVDLVYLDPMFPAAKRKSALPKRRMQWLRRYLDSQQTTIYLDSQALGPAADALPAVEAEVHALLDLARRVASKVVVKRADDGPVVGKPSSQVASSKVVRYDIYTGLASKP